MTENANDDWISTDLMKTRLATITEITHSDDGVYMSYSHDPDRSLLPAFAEALLEHARCAHCNASLVPDFRPCGCSQKRSRLSWLEDDSCSLLRAEHSAWRDVLKPLWNKDRRRVYSQTSRDRRAQYIKESDEPAYTASDIAFLRKAQRDACYYCGISIDPGAQVEHLDPLTWGGSNGFANIMLACASCNTAKHSLNERQFWRILQKQLPADEYDRRRTAAKEMKKIKWRFYREAVTNP